jgi:hypothetical protein
MQLIFNLKFALFSNVLIGRLAMPAGWLLAQQAGPARWAG